MAHCSRTLQIGERYPKLKIKYAFFEKHGMYFSLPSTHLRGRHFENFSYTKQKIQMGINVFKRETFWKNNNILVIDEMQT